MLKFILCCCLEVILMLFIFIIIFFFMMCFVLGSFFIGECVLLLEVLVNIEVKYYLNDFIMMQYFSYLKQLVYGDFGLLFKYKDYMVNDLVVVSFFVLVKFGVVVFLLVVIIGVSVGVIVVLK